MSGHGQEVLAGSLALMVIMTAACGTGLTSDAESGPTPPPILTASPTTPPTSTPEPSPTGPAVPTVQTLEAHLDTILDSVRGNGTLVCEGSGPIGRGTALTCQRTYEDGPGWVPPDATVLVAVLDDTGRYTFTNLAEPYAAPDDYPAGTISCGKLATGGTHPAAPGLSYSALLHHWMSLGSPSSMDHDGDGRPCEGVYPANIVARTATSPLVPRTGPAPQPVTLQDVRAHAEAVINGTTGPQTTLGEWVTEYDSPPRRWEGAHCSSDEMAHAGSTMYCANDNDLLGWEAPGVFISVLDDTGRYTMTWGCCCAECPNVGRYPDTSTCADLSQEPRNEQGGYSGRGISYGQLLYRWMTLGRPSDWDSDGDGRPCEDYWASDEIDAVMSSTLRP